MIKISYIHSTDRIYNIERALALIKTEITKGLKDAKKIVIKLNAISGGNSYGATNPSTLEAVLNFVQPFLTKQLVIAEGSKDAETLDLFKNYGYLKLQDRFDFAIIDLNKDELIKKEYLGLDGKSKMIMLSKTLVESDYIISLNLPKMDKDFVYSGTIKNIAAGALPRIQQGIGKLNTIGILRQIFPNQSHRIDWPADLKECHHLISTIFSQLNVKLAIIDGYESMAGNGPIEGEMVPTHFALASTFPAQTDAISCMMIGVDPDEIGYFQQLNPSFENLFVVGDDWKKHLANIRKPDSYDKIRQPKSELV